MNYEWDEAKNRANIRRHGFDFADAADLFSGPVLVHADTREDYGEERWVGLGLVGVRLVQIVYTQPKPDTIRIISLRKATSYERKEFEKAIQDRLETH